MNESSVSLTENRKKSFEPLFLAFFSVFGARRMPVTLTYRISDCTCPSRCIWFGPCKIDKI